MTLWDAYLLFLHRLGLGPHPFPDTEGGDDFELDFETVQWFPAAKAGEAINPWSWIGLPMAGLITLIGQLSLASFDQPWLGVFGLIVGAGLFVFEVWRLKLDWRRLPNTTAQVAPIAEPLPGIIDPPKAQVTVRWPFVFLAYIATALTFIFSAKNDFNIFAQLSWAASLALWLVAFWEGNLPLNRERLYSLLDRRWPSGLNIHLPQVLFLLAIVLAVSAWFRFAKLDEVPAAMTSDHVEKLLDANDILVNGKRPIFESSNGGREPLAFYLTALAGYFNGGRLDYLTLKLVMSVAGFLALPFIFLLAREIADDDLTGLFAALCAGLSWWPNVVSRNGLRFPFAMLFSAIGLWLIVRALRRKRRNDLLLAGVTLGVGLYGYTPVRVVPVAVAAALTLYALHRWQRGATFRMIAWGAMLMMIVLAAFMPMLRYAIDEPENFWRRTATRLTGEPGLEKVPPTWQVFLENEWNSLRMFNDTADSAWLISPAGQPALDWVMGALFFAGAALLVYRYIRYRDWLDLFLLLAIPILLLPSTLALAFPVENPSLHRSGAAIPIVFVIVAVPLRLLVTHAQKILPGWLGRAIGLGLAGVLLLISAQENWDILFVRYANQYKSSVQNAPEIGEVVRGWATSAGDWDTVMVKAFPYWVDTRAVGIYAGRLGWNNVALEINELDDLKDDPRPKLFVLHNDDEEAVDFLRRIYPEGTLTYHTSEYTDKHFFTYIVPGALDFDEKLLEQP